jgi:hypothetical protein
VRLRIVVFLLACAWAASTDAQPLGTAFTYQGRLVENGTPATGPYDLEIKLFDAPAGGTQLFTTLLYEDVAVGNGLFTVALDFGPGTFEGSARWLEIGVRPGASTGAFTTLPARQELTPSPNAIFGATTPWAGILGKPAGFADDVDDDSGGDITSVSTPPGNGLVGGGTTGALTLGVAFGGSGSGGAVSRVDHHHVGQTWVATANPALTIASSATSGAAIEGQATALSGLAVGMRGSSTSSQGVGVLGMNTSTAGLTLGVNGFVASPDGIAVQGFASENSGSSIGVKGLSDSANGRGVFGHATANSGGAHGVFGETESVGNIVVASGVSGHATSTTGFNFGVRGVAASTSGVGVAGLASATSGTTIGMWGMSQSNLGAGVRAEGSGSTGTALEIVNGRIKATGAGVDTPTPAFRIAYGEHECLGGSRVVIDHPQANNNGAAMLFVTARGHNLGESVEPHSFALEFQSIGFADCPMGRWVIRRENSTIDSGYNVLIVVP